MTIKEYLDYLENAEGDREVLRPLMAALSPVSQQTMLTFQNKAISESDGDYDKFVIAQNKELKQCVELELSELGTEVRKNFDLPPLTLETEV